MSTTEETFDRFFLLGSSSETQGAVGWSRRNKSGKKLNRPSIYFLPRQLTAREFVRMLLDETHGTKTK